MSLIISMTLSLCLQNFFVVSGISTPFYKSVSRPYHPPSSLDLTSRSSRLREYHARVDQNGLLPRPVLSESTLVRRYLRLRARLQFSTRLQRGFQKDAPPCTDKHTRVMVLNGDIKLRDDRWDFAYVNQFDEGLNFPSFLSNINASPSQLIDGSGVQIGAISRLVQVNTAFGFSESCPDKHNANGAERHTYHRSYAHDLTPPRGYPLRGKVILYALILACGLLSFANAIRIGFRRSGDATPYIIFGIGGIVAGGIGCAMFMGSAY